MDGFAAYRNELVASGQRRGHTLAVDWGAWRDGGMVMDDQALARLERDGGIVPSPRAGGVEALYRSLASGADQTLCLSFRDQRSADTLAATVATVSPAAKAAPAGLPHSPTPVANPRPRLVDYL